MQESQAEEYHHLIEAIFYIQGFFLKQGTEMVSRKVSPKTFTQTILPLCEATTAFPPRIFLFFNGYSQFNDVTVEAASTVALNRPQGPDSGLYFPSCEVK